jgi:hypothetical protein
MAKVKKRGNSWQIDYTDPNGKRIRKAFRKNGCQKGFKDYFGRAG